MIYEFTEVKEPLRKIITALHSKEIDVELLGRPYDGKITVEKLERTSCNHRFTDMHELFGISEMDAHKIRDYFQQLCGDKRKRGPYGHILDLKENFSNMLDQERRGWLESYVNHNRIKEGFEPISF